MSKNKHDRKNTAPAQATQEPAQAAQAAPAPAPSAAPVNAALAVVYKAGKAYNVRIGTAQDNARTWDAVQKCLTEKGGQCTRAELVAAVQQFNHAPFVAYAIRRGWLVPA